MSSPDLDPTHPAPAQIRYANLLFTGSWYALLLMIISFVLYISGMANAYIPLPQLPSYWRLPAREYLVRTQVPDGWQWVHLAGHGDFLSLAATVLLMSLSLICPLVLLPVALRRSDRALAAGLILQLGLLGLAAAGILLPIRY